jgi:aminoglycoside phosphotransferase (APT) family kinase protein
MYIHPAHHRRGIGTQMLASFDRLAEAKRLDEIFLTCGPHLEGFYGQIGFRNIVSEIQAPPFLVTRKAGYEKVYGPQLILCRSKAERHQAGWPKIEGLSAPEAARFIQAQFHSPSKQLRGERHGQRWIGLDEQHVYLIPRDATESSRLSLERSVIEWLGAARCPVPKVVHASLSLHVRTKVAGTTLHDGEHVVFGPGDLPIDRYSRSIKFTKQGERLADDLGRAIASCHQVFAGKEAELERLGLRRFRFDGAKIAESIQGHLSQQQKARLLSAVARYDATSDPLVFCHGDLNHHNFCSDAETGYLNGIFDFGDCCLGARELDFKFLLSNGRQFLDRSVARYEDIVGTRLDQQSILDHHIIEAAENLRYALANPHHGVERCRGWLFAALDLPE